MATDREALLAAMGIPVPPSVDPAIAASVPPVVDPYVELVQRVHDQRADEASRLRAALLPAAPEPLTAGTPDDSFLTRLGRSAGRLAHNPVVRYGAAAAGGPLGLASLAFTGGDPGAHPHASEPSAARPEAAPHGPVGDEAPVVTSPGGAFRHAPAETAPEQPARYAPGSGGSAFGGLVTDVKRAQQAHLDTVQRGADLSRELGIEHSARVMSTSELREQNAARIQHDAEEQARIDGDAAKRHQTFLARNEALADELGRLGTDPARLLRNASLGARITFGMGAALAGGNAMLNGNNGNTSIDRMMALVNQDIGSQLQDIDSKRASLSARSSLFAQMLAETGDRRLAAMQTRKLVYDAMDLKFKADADRLGIPEYRTTAELLANEIEQKRDLEVRGIAERSLQLAQQQASAAAAQARAQAEKDRQYLLDLARLNLQQQEIDIKRDGAASDINKQTQQLGEKLSDKNLAEGRAAVENSKRRLAAAKPNEGLPGVGPMGDFRAGLKPEGISKLNPWAVTANGLFGLNDAERVARGDWEKVKLAYQKQITGSGASESERKMLADAFEGARTPAEQRNAIAQADDYFARIEAAAKAGYDPRVVKLYEARKGAIRPELPPSVKPTR